MKGRNQRQSGVGRSAFVFRFLCWCYCTAHMRVLPCCACLLRLSLLVVLLKFYPSFLFRVSLPPHTHTCSRFHCSLLPAIQPPAPSTHSLSLPRGAQCLYVPSQRLAAAIRITPCSAPSGAWCFRKERTSKWRRSSGAFFGKRKCGLGSLAGFDN